MGTLRKSVENQVKSMACHRNIWENYDGQLIGNYLRESIEHRGFHHHPVNGAERVVRLAAVARTWP